WSLTLVLQNGPVKRTRFQDRRCLARSKSGAECATRPPSSKDSTLSVRGGPDFSLPVRLSSFRLPGKRTAGSRVSRGGRGGCRGGGRGLRRPRPGRSRGRPGPGRGRARGGGDAGGGLGGDGRGAGRRRRSGGSTRRAGRCSCPAFRWFLWWSVRSRSGGV